MKRRKKKSNHFELNAENTSNVMIESSQSLKCVMGIMSIDAVTFFLGRSAKHYGSKMHFEYLVGSCDLTWSRTSNKFTLS